VELKKVNLSKNALKTLDGLTYCTGLTFLNISENQVRTDATTPVVPYSYNLRRIRARASPVGKCVEVACLLVVHLQIETLAGLHKLGLLAVLNASKNSLTHIEGIARLGKLKALILNDNKLKRIPHLAKLAELNTLGMTQRLLCPMVASWCCLERTDAALFSSCVFRAESYRSRLTRSIVFLCSELQ
jgi:hypothetical protein